jgi:uncharacterized protein (TIGR04222 family)
MMMNPFALDGAHFLLLYAVLLAATWLLCRYAAERLRPEGRRQQVTDADSLALLSGGTQRLAEVAATRLMAAGQLRHADKDRFVPGGKAGPVASTLDRALLGLPMPVRWRDVSKVAAVEGKRLRHRLEMQRLLLDDGQRAQLRLVQALPLAALLAFGALRLAQGIPNDKPVGYLTLLMVLTLVLLIRSLVIDPRSRAGIGAVKAAQDAHRRLRLAAPDAEAGLAVALFGTVVLTGSWLETLHRLRSSSGGVGADTSADGDGGCGGCGGCS